MRMRVLTYTKKGKINRIAQKKQKYIDFQTQMRIVLS